MKFEFDATGLDGIEVVVFETVGVIDPDTDEYTVIASHEDLEDAGQTIKIVKKAPKTGLFTNGSSADVAIGGSNTPVIIAAVAVPCIAVIYLSTRFAAKKRFMGRR